MHISEFQRWIEEYDRARGWDRVLPSHTLAHVLEEMGEVAREVLTLEGYRAGDAEAARARLAEELGDCLTLLLKLAYQCGVDAEAALQNNQIKAERRFSVEQGQQDMERYLASQAENLARLPRDERTALPRSMHTGSRGENG
jgi:NTP pyrophosphatase (non-canonical NTP hydrolase)